MLVRHAEIPAAEAQAFERAVRACGRDPCGFRVQMYEPVVPTGGLRMRRVHVASDRAAVQYDATRGAAWTQHFARHLVRGFFG